MIKLTLDKTSFVPGEKLRGVMEWENHGKVPKTLGVRVGWHTEGKGDTDQHLVQEAEFPPSASGSQRFSCTLPDGPYSLHGTLISIIWTVEGYMDDGAFSAEKSEGERFFLSFDEQAVKI